MQTICEVCGCDVDVSEVAKCLQCGLDSECILEHGCDDPWQQR